jgi:hypothetical protein
LINIKDLSSEEQWEQTINSSEHIKLTMSVTEAYPINLDSEEQTAMQLEVDSQP